jgi:SH3 domain-containing YSC84-like protein 1
MRFRTVLVLLVLLALPALAQSQLSRDVDPQQVIDDAQRTLQDMTMHPDFEPLRAELQTARGVLIFPRVIRGGFFVGGSGGLGVFLAYDEERGDFSPVGFYSLGSVSLGLQFGGEVAEVVMVARTQRAVDSLFASAFRLGGDASVAAGPVGVGRRASVTADFLSFARSRGAFVGLSLDGSMLRVRDDFNEVYYDRAVRPVEIIQSRLVDNPGTLPLRGDLLAHRLRPVDPVPEPEPAPGPVPYRDADPVEPGSGGLTIEELQVEKI